MTLRGLGLAAATCLLVDPPASYACSTASCSLASRPEDGSLGRGRIQIEVSYRYVDQSHRHYGAGPLQVEGAPEPPVLRPRVDFEQALLVPGYHQEWRMGGSFGQLDLGYGLTSRLTVLASLPMGARVVDHLYFPAPGPANHAHVNAGISRQDFRTSGFGDAQLVVRRQIGSSWAVGGGLKLATGSSTRQDEYGGTADPMQQPGTGAVAWLASVQHARRDLPLGLSGTMTATYQRSSQNDLGYRMGDEIFLTIRGSRDFGRRVSATLQLKGWHAARNVFQGQPSPSTGGSALYAVPGVSWKGPGSVRLYGGVQVPIVERFNEGQLGTHLVVLAGVSRSF